MKKAAQKSASAHQRRGSRAGPGAGFGDSTSPRGVRPRLHTGDDCKTRGAVNPAGRRPGRAGAICDDGERADARPGAGRGRGGVPVLTDHTAASCKCTATGSSERSRMPRTRCRRRCWPPGRPPGVRGPRSVRTWLYRIATNRWPGRAPRQSGAPRRGSRRHGPAARAHPRTEPVWLEPYPDALLDGIPGRNRTLGALRARESISLAFVDALQLLPPRQLAALVLRDVLGFRAAEVAEILDTGEASVKGALQRARATLETRLPDRRTAIGRHGLTPARERMLAGRFADAHEARRHWTRSSPCSPTTPWLTMPPQPLGVPGA